MSERACSILGIDRSLVRYRQRRGDDADLRARLRDLAAMRRRFGYRRPHVLLAREGITVNNKKLRRLYGEERLQVRRRGGRKRVMGTRAPLALPSGPNQRWSLDFLSDALGDGRRFCILAVVDDFTRECLALVADTSLPGIRLVRDLEALASRRGRPFGEPLLPGLPQPARPTMSIRSDFSPLKGHQQFFGQTGHARSLSVLTNLGEPTYQRKSH